MRGRNDHVTQEEAQAQTQEETPLIDLFNPSSL